MKMNGRYRFLAALIIILIVWRSVHYFKTNDEKFLQEVNKVELTVYYEALCPDSKSFIIHQLLPTFEDLQELITIDFVPYGKAKTQVLNEEIIFQCQHDEVECEANKIHACVIDIVKNPLLQVKYVACMITDNIMPTEAGERCAQESNIDYAPISQCATSIKGSSLLKAHGDRTNNLRPPAHFIPTIELNGSQSLVAQSNLLKDLKKSICRLLKFRPSKCTV